MVFLALPFQYSGGVCWCSPSSFPSCPKLVVYMFCWCIGLSGLGGVLDGRLRLSFTPAWYCMWRSACASWYFCRGAQDLPAASLSPWFSPGPGFLQVISKLRPRAVAGRHWLVQYGPSWAYPVELFIVLPFLGGQGSAGYSMGYGCFLGVFIMLVCGSIFALSIHTRGFGAECSCGCVLARASCSVADAL